MTVDLGPIPPKRFFTISEASTLCGVSQNRLRIWEERFDGIFKVERRKGRRYFTPENLVVIREIRALLDDVGYTTDGVIQHFNDKNKKSKAMPRQVVASELREILASLKEVRQRLKDL